LKLLFDLNEADSRAFNEACGKDEKLMYCLPFNIHEDKFVDGYMAFTNKYIYKILDGKVLETFPIEGTTDFHTEVMYGSCGFYANFGGTAKLICRFISGRNLARYAVIIKACKILTETGSDEPVTDSTPERFCPKCGRPFIAHTSICPFCLNKSEVYKKLWAMTKGLRLMIFFPFIVSAFSVVVSFVVPWIEAIAVNEYITANPETTKLEGFLLIVAAIVFMDLVSRALGVIQSRLAAISGNKFVLTLRNLLYEKLQSLSLAAIQRRSAGDLMQRIRNDTIVMREFMTTHLPQLFVQAASFIFALIILTGMNLVMSLFVFVPIPLVVFAIFKFWEIISMRSKKAWILNTRANHQLQDVLNGIRVVKSFGQEDREIGRFIEHREAQARQNESNAKFFDTFFPILGFVVRLGSYLILLYGNILVFRGKMQIGTLHQFNTYSNTIYNPLIYITSIPRNISNFLTSASKVFEILEENPEIEDIALPIDIRIEGDISVRNVTFGYESYDPVLENINVDIKAGEMLGIVGHSGCGKTTLINLIMRLYEVNEGEIIIDNVNIRDISQEALRSQIGVVLQETFLFSGTIADNIKYSKPTATDEEIIAAARIANAHDFITNLPEGYNTMVGEKGFSLSGGERQRIAIARAIIHNPRILILDEATAALDTETEKLIQDALNKLVRGRTTIAIAHRLSTLRNADKLLVLDKGRVAEFGTHTELLDKKGIYYKLVMAQRKMAHEIVNEGEEA